MGWSRGVLREVVWRCRVEGVVYYWGRCSRRGRAGLKKVCDVV